MRILTILLALFPAWASAAFDSQFGLGTGTQYGGAVGMKYSLNGENNKFYIGAGRSDFFEGDEDYGLSLGWENALTNKHSLGLGIRTKTRPVGGYYLTGTAEQPRRKELKKRYESFVAGTYTYYFTSNNEPGFLTGLSVGKTYQETNITSGFKSGIEYGAFLGYQF
ncbi:hypothetical protein [Microbulbifer sp.]|uniref:hypothetical protein n=1 Tax=Microbulbifer sp. TaxID=1908541 RepID=UPI00258F5B08|nr:hypothetical protein [Microbulbifer sp.]